MTASGSIDYEGETLHLSSEESSWLSAIGLTERPIGRKVPRFLIYAENVSVNEFMSSAEKAGLLTPEKIQLYSEYRDRKKESWTKPTAIIDLLYNEILNVSQPMENDKP